VDQVIGMGAKGYSKVGDRLGLVITWQ